MPSQIEVKSQLFLTSVATCGRLDLRRRDVEPLGNYMRKGQYGSARAAKFYGLAGSMGAGGFRESGGRPVYDGSFGLTRPGEPSTVTLRLVSQSVQVAKMYKVR